MKLRWLECRTEDNEFVGLQITDTQLKGHFLIMFSEEYRR